MCFLQGEVVALFTVTTGGLKKTQIHLSSVQNPGWLMISSGILLPSIFGIIIIIQERGIPINQAGFNRMIAGF